ncbi:MAG TPA: hypothetical protein VF283_04800 [Bryobacteraceae bacterium]
MLSANRASAGSDVDLLRSAVQQILGSSIFQRTHRLSQLLCYVLERTAERDFDSLKESVIGARVFNRPAAYNPAEDNIVRSNIHQLRLKLAEYYATVGATDPWRVSIPKGSYGLVLEEHARAIESQVVGSASPSVSAPKAWPLRQIAISSLIAVLAASVIFVIYLGGKQAKAAKTNPPKSLLSLLVPDPGQQLTVVVPDGNLQLYERLTGRTVLLQDYVKRQFLQPAELQKISPSLARSAHALFADPTTQSFVLDVIPRFARVVPAATLSVRNPDSLNMKDFQKGNTVLISGPYGDPWVQLFDRNLNFQIETNRGNVSAHIVDRHPEGSEKKDYYNYVDSTNTTVCYARVAYLPGLTAGTNVLLAGGPHIASTEAACLFLTRHESLSAVRRLFHLKSVHNLPYFELLIQSRALGNAPWEMKIVAGRIVPGE